MFLEQPHRGHRIPIEQGALGERGDRVGAEGVDVGQCSRETMRLRQVSSGSRRLERGSECVSRLGLEPDPRAVHPVGEFRTGTIVEPPQRLCHTHAGDLTMAQGGQIRRQLRE